jgi:hypothetical protein
MTIRPNPCIAHCVLTVLAALAWALTLSGCALSSTASAPIASATAIAGKVHGGQQAVVGAHVYLLAATTNGYGTVSSSLLTSGTAGTDSIGGYVLTDANGGFSITGDYLCTANTQVYLYALGGNPGAGVNSAAGFLAALGSCPAAGSFIATIPYVFMNEVSTVAAAFALSPFASVATNVSSGATPQSVIGIANAFANAAQLADIGTGIARTITPNGNGTVSTAAINTIANILASCVNSTGPASTACTTLFANARFNGTTGLRATDTASAAIYLARRPGAAVAALFALQTGVGSPFAPALTTQPDDLTVSIHFKNDPAAAFPQGLAIDYYGNVWTSTNTGVVELSNLGAVISAGGGYTCLGQIQTPSPLAIDYQGNVWIPSETKNWVSEMDSTGACLSSTGAYTGGGLNDPQAIALDGNGHAWVANQDFNVTSFPYTGSTAAVSVTGGGVSYAEAVATDPQGDAWFANYSGGSVSKFSSSRTALSPDTIGFTGGGLYEPTGIAIDGSGDAWVTNYTGSGGFSLVELSSSGAVLSGTSGFTGGGLNYPDALAIDGLGNIWVANQVGNSVSQFTNTGTAQTPATGYDGGQMKGPTGVGIDPSGNVWVANSNNNSFTELIGAGGATATPLSFAARIGSIGVRP